MRKSLLVFTAFIFVICFSCRQKTDIAKEREAILKVIQDKGDAYAKNDLNRFFETHIQDTTSLRLVDSILYLGWSQIKDLYTSYIEQKINLTDYQNWKNLKENVIIKVIGDCAWVICDNTWEFDYRGEPSSITNIEIDFFEKTNNQWKVSFSTFTKGSLTKAHQLP